MRFLAAVYRFLLSLRYDVRIDGLELLPKEGPILLLPNHQALVDPQILIAQVMRKRLVSPVMSALFFHLPIVGMLFRRMGAIPVPDILSADQGRIDPGALLADVTAALADGRCVLLYPSGQIAGQGREAIFGRQMTYWLLRSLPEGTRVIAVRIRGLWGSMWSRAWVGRTPNVVTTFLKAIGYILANGIFFGPRRDVSLTFMDITERAREKSRESLVAFNTFLEATYNVEGDELVRFLRHTYFRRRFKRTLPARIEASIADLQAVNHIDYAELDPTVLTFVREKLRNISKNPAAMIDASSHLVFDLHLDSLGLAEIVTILQAQYPNAGNPPLTNLRTVADLCLLAMGKIDDRVLNKP